MHGRKMGPHSVFDGLEHPAATQRVSFGPICRFSMPAKDFTCRINTALARLLRIKTSVVLLVAGLWCLSAHGADGSDPHHIDEVSRQSGSIQWDTDQTGAQQRQERYRVVVPMPDAFGQNVPRSAIASLVNGPKAVAAQTPPLTASPGNLLQNLLIAAALSFCAVLMIQKFVPGILMDLNRSLNPWSPSAASGKNLSAKVRAEEEAFGKFLETFRVGPPTSPSIDSTPRENPLNEFYAQVKKRLVTLRKFLRDIGRQSGDAGRQKLLANLRFEIGLLMDEAGFPEALPVWQLASALEGLVKQLAEHIKNATPSTLRTIDAGLTLLDHLSTPDLPPNLLAERPARFLVVDDDPISRQALSLSLKKAFGQPDLAVDGVTALAQASRHAYDVIFLDVQMPGMDGFELCTKIHNTVPNRLTPVVFVTCHSDFDARCKSTLSGGNDLMGKPFLTFEVCVKALTLAWEGRLGRNIRTPSQRPDPARDSMHRVPTVTDVACPAPDLTTALQPSPAAAPSPEMDPITDAFLDRLSKHLGPFRDLCQKALLASNEETRQNRLAEGFLRLNSWMIRNGAEPVHPAYQLGAALEGLFRKMLQDSRHATPSALDTMTTAVDLLSDLCVPGMKTDLAIHPPIHMLVVDDDLVTRRCIVGALQTAFNKADSVENGEAALALALEKPFDVIFLDVVMPGMDGFEVCSRIRDSVPNRTTPVVFVTGHADFDAHARMSRIGGDGLMGKPFLISEITVKALTFALRGRLDRLNAGALTADLNQPHSPVSVP